MEIFHAKLNEIRDGNLLAMVDELERVCPVASAHFHDRPLSLFLTQCVYPAGDGVRVPIKTDTSLDCVLLETRVGGLPDGLLWDLCGELAGKGGKAREFFEGSRLCVFLSKTIPKQQKQKSISANQQRLNGVNRTRRNNR